MLQLPEQELPCSEEAAVAPWHTLPASPTCSSHSGTALYDDTYVAGYRNLDV